jgi:hypothetical protein
MPSTSSTRKYTGGNFEFFLATSLDGFLARPDGGIDWLFSDEDDGSREFFAGIDAVVPGRKTRAM